MGWVDRAGKRWWYGERAGVVHARRAMRAWVVAGMLGALALGAGASSAVAQEREVAAPTPEQSQTLTRAVGLAREERYAEALAIYDQLVRELDMDLLHLNRGRVLQKMGRCVQAREAFDRVLKAKRDPNIAESTIRDGLKRYSEELSATCKATLQVLCGLPAMQVRIDGQAPISCTKANNLKLDPGRYQVEVEAYGQTATKMVALKAGREEMVRMNFKRDQQVAVGRMLLGQGKAAEALEFFEGALKNGGAQDVYLYVVEALLERRLCQSANITLETAPTAPPSNTLSPLEFSRRLNDMRKAFSATCGEKVLVQCKPADMTLRIDNGTPQICSAAPLFLPVGEHTIQATRAQDAEASEPELGPDGAPVVKAPLRMTRTVNVQPGKVHRVEIDMTEPERFGSLTTWGAVLGGAGVAALLTSVVIDQALIAPEIDTYNSLSDRFSETSELNETRDTIDTLQLTNTLVIGTGAALILAGGVLVAVDAATIERPAYDAAPSEGAAQPTPEPSVNVGVGASPDGASILLHGVW